MKKKILVIRGVANAGKTTTAGFVYRDLISMGGGTHIFDGNTVTKDSLTISGTGVVKDFVTILNHNGQQVAIISAGDVWGDLLAAINALPRWDVLVCCARTRTSVTYKNLVSMFGSQIAHVENIQKQSNNSKASKQAYVNSIISNI